MTEMTVSVFRERAGQALLGAGASAAMARSLIAATLSAEAAGRPEVGIAHLPDYLNGVRDGRIDGQAVPVFEPALPAFIVVDARGGIAQLGFDLAFDDLVARAKTFGMATFAQRGSYTAGEIGYYARRLAQAGLVALAVANAHAMMATKPGGKIAFSTNPLAFGAPLPPPLMPLVFDQASSATAFVNLARAAAANAPIPEGWALDGNGEATTDARAALGGALLPFGGYKGANIALMVETLAAGLAGAEWSLDVANFQTGERPLGTGLTILALCPVDADAFRARLGAFCARLSGRGVHIPGSAARSGLADDDLLDVPPGVLQALAA